MDKFVSIAAFPIGVLVCFGPAIVVWYFTEWRHRDKNRSPLVETPEPAQKTTPH